VRGQRSITLQKQIASSKVLTEMPMLTPKEAPVIETVADIEDKLLEAYLTSRAIPIDLARTYLKQITYRVGGRGYRALGFKNELGGYELRNATFKGTIGAKALTHLRPSKHAQPSLNVAVFE
jgi:hypothetical protein